MAAGQEPATLAATQGAANDSPLEQAVMAQEAAAEPAAAQPEVVVPDPLPEPYTSLFKHAREAPTEFNTWTSLISAAEKLADIGRIRQVYDAFLAEYPLCYGYWKKYADAEAKYVSLEEASLVYDRGVAAVPYSVDLWGHYAMHKQKVGAPVEEVERLFERGLAYVGMDYLSHGLWDKYLTYELGLGAHAQVAQLYSRLLRMPIQRLDEYRTRFHEYAAGHSAAELVSGQERASIASKLVQQHKEQQAAQEAAAAEAAAAAQAAQAAAEQNAATAAQAAGNTDTAQAMDTTADGDDAFDATAEETVAAAGHMLANIDAPAAVTTADCLAVDDAPVAEAGPDAANPIPSMLTVPTPDDIAATVMAGAAAAATDSDVPTAAAPLSVPPATETSFPASGPPAGFALAPPQVYPSKATESAVDTDMPQVTIPQSDGPGDDPMDEAAAVTEAAAAPPAPAAFTDPSSAASSDTVATSVVVGYAVADPASASLATKVAPMQTSADPAVQAAAAGTEAGMIVPEAPQAAVPATAEELITDEQIKAAWLTSVDEVYTVTKEEWYRRKPFEDAIKRPYFHVKPLDLAQLQNWSRYLDYIEEKKDIGMIIRLYERCLVACASYPDLWMRYVRWQEISSKAAAQVALERATSVHCKRRPEIQLFAAHFHERHGNLDTARALFRLVTERLAPTLIPGAVQHANFERRRGSKAAACAVYDKFLEREAGKDSSTYVFVVIQYMNALQCGFQDTQKAREVYNAALKKAQDSIMLWEGIIHFEENLPGSDRLARVLDIYNRAVAPADVAKPDSKAAAAADAPATNGVAEDGVTVSEEAAKAAAPQALPDSDRELLSTRSIDFVDTYGDANLLAKVEQQHSQRFKLPGKVAMASTSRKRSAEAADGAASKAAKTAAAATPAAAASYAAAGALPGPPAATGAAQSAAAAAASQAYYSSAAPYYQYPQAYPTAQQPYAYPAASAAAAPAYQYQGYYG
ncbi:TPA: hypothetical protein ACH3X1_012070 [Trebouxia sp. C0004]